LCHCAVVAGGVIDMRSHFLHPSPRFWVAHEIEQPAQKGGAIAAPQPKSCCVWRECVGKLARIVEDLPNRVSNHVSDGRRVFAIREQSDAICDGRVTGKPCSSTHFPICP
jgi:hypothetical protein